MRRLIAAVLLAGLAGGLVACAHLGALDQLVYDTTRSLVTNTEMACLADPATPTHCTKDGGLTDQQFHQASVIEHAMAVQGQSFNKLLIAKTAQPADALDLLKAVRDAIAGLAAIPGFSSDIDKLTTLEGRLVGFAGALAPPKGNQS